MEFETRLPYARDRLVECYTWSVSVFFEPQYALGRRTLTKVIGITSIIDDTYDAHATIDELQVFTDAVHRFVSLSLITSVIT